MSHNVNWPVGPAETLAAEENHVYYYYYYYYYYYIYDYTYTSSC